MKREVTRERELPSFKFSIKQLSTLWERMFSLFQSEMVTFQRIRIELEKEEITFDSIDELSNYSDSLKQITVFDIYVSSSSKSICVSNNLFSFYKPKVCAHGDSVAWCAGAVESIYDFVNKKKLWYHWFFRIPFFGIFSILNIIFLVCLFIFYYVFKVHILPDYIIGYFLIISVLGILGFLRRKLFSSASIILVEDSSFFRKHVVEITITIALITCIATIVAMINTFNS